MEQETLNTSTRADENLKLIIAALQNTAAGSRETDLAVFNALREEEPPWRFIDDEWTIISRDQYGPGALGNPVLSLEYFTTSIDDALTLVPAEDGVTFHRYLNQGGRSWACVFKSYTDGSPRPPGILARPEWVCCANTEALAICAAALSARITP